MAEKRYTICILLTILEVKDLTMDFGGLRALDHLDLNVAEAEMC